MGRPRKPKVLEEEGIVLPPRPKPQILDGNFGYPRPAPKPSQTKKVRYKKEESEN